MTDTDHEFYKNSIAPILPPEVLDFHVHTWSRECWKEVPWESEKTGAKYMVTLEEYSIESLLSDRETLFPDRPCHIVPFGFPTPAANLGVSNAYTARAAACHNMYPLFITGRDSLPPEELKRTITKGGFFGYKVHLNWQGDDYGSVRISDMIGPAEMQLANELKLVVLLHVPRSERLADPYVQAGVRELSKEYPDAGIVLAHCGRAYLPYEMQKAINAIRDLPNIYLDTAMVMEPTVMLMALETIGPRRVVYATDLPIANMKGRRVYVKDHWVDLVMEGYPPSSYRIGSNNMRATYMVYEIILALKLAADMAGLSQAETSGLFFENGMSLLSRVMDGQQLVNARERWVK